MILKPAARYPADPRAVFILALSVLSGATALVLHEAPDSLRGIMPEWAVVVWGVILALGSAITLLGMYFQNVNGIIIEQIGSVMVAAATIFYSVVIFRITGLAAIQSIGVILAWGLACALRWVQLQVLLHDGIRRAAKFTFLEAVEHEIQSREAAHGRKRK